MDYSLPGSSQGIFQARVLEWVACYVANVKSVMCACLPVNVQLLLVAIIIVLNSTIKDMDKVL